MCRTINIFSCPEKNHELLLFYSLANRLLIQVYVIGSGYRDNIKVQMGYLQLFELLTFFFFRSKIIEDERLAEYRLGSS